MRLHQMSSLIKHFGRKCEAGLDQRSHQCLISRVLHPARSRGPNRLLLNCSSLQLWDRSSSLSREHSDFLILYSTKLVVNTLTSRLWFSSEQDGPSTYAVTDLSGYLYTVMEEHSYQIKHHRSLGFVGLPIEDSIINIHLMERFYRSNYMVPIILAQYTKHK